MPRFYETTLSITNLHNLSISTHVNRSRINSNDLFRDSLKTVKIMFETKATILRSSKHFE